MQQYLRDCSLQFNILLVALRRTDTPWEVVFRPRRSVAGRRLLCGAFQQRSRFYGGAEFAFAFMSALFAVGMH